MPDGVPPADVFRRVLGDSKPDATGIRLTGEVSREFTAELWREPSRELCLESFFSLLKSRLISRLDSPVGEKITYTDGDEVTELGLRFRLLLRRENEAIDWDTPSANGSGNVAG